MRALDHPAYLRRKQREIGLLERCLGAAPRDTPAPCDVDDVLAVKLRLAAALRARHCLDDWSITETACAEPTSRTVGPYRLTFGYQRADLAVDGPPVYPVPSEGSSPAVRETLYTSCGMAALATLFVALDHTNPGAVVYMARRGYAETRELIERVASRIAIEPIERLAAGAARERSPCRALFLDSGCVEGLPVLDRLPVRAIDLVIFDTTCYARTSGRVRRVLRWCLEHRVPIALVRSHVKLDSLGVEYGRLGSLVIASPHAARRIVRLVRESRAALRLLGAAALPAHLVPFAHGEAYTRCTRQRICAIVLNTRRLARRLRATPLGPTVVRYAHGLYLAIAPLARDVASMPGPLSGFLRDEGLPVRHAGSFGFDFIAIERHPHPGQRRDVLRIAPGDVPLETMDRLADALDRWFAGPARAARDGRDDLTLAAHRRRQPADQRQGERREACDGHADLHPHEDRERSGHQRLDVQDLAGKEADHVEHDEAEEAEQPGHHPIQASIGTPQCRRCHHLDLLRL